MHGENISQLENDVEQGAIAETTTCDYVDKLMSTMNPNIPDGCAWNLPEIHPCKKRYNYVNETEAQEDYVNLLNMVQRHTNCSSAYRLKDHNIVLKCRFGYPFEICEKTHLEYEQLP